MSDVCMVVFTEDSGRHGSATVTALVKKLLQQVAPNLRTNELDLRDAGPAAKRAMRGHDWKSRRSDHRRNLVNELATRLVTGDLVVLHYCPLADKHNLALANNAWPADRAAERSPSWRQTVARWSDSRELQAHLTGKTPPTTTP